jgi:hypothetical protein
MAPADRAGQEAAKSVPRAAPAGAPRTVRARVVEAVRKLREAVAEAAEAVVPADAMATLANRGCAIPELAAAAAATRAPAVLMGLAETGAEAVAATTAQAAAARAVCLGKVRKAAPAAVVVVDLRTLKVLDTCWKAFEEGRLLAMARSLSPGKERIRRKFERLSVTMRTPA